MSIENINSVNILSSEIPLDPLNDKTFLAFLKFQVKGIFNNQTNNCDFNFIQEQLQQKLQQQHSNFKNCFKKLYQLFQQIIIKKCDPFSDFFFHPLNIIDCFKTILNCSLTQEEVSCFNSPWLNGMFVDLSTNNCPFNTITISSIFKDLCLNGYFETLQWLYKCDNSCILFNKTEKEGFFINMCRQPHDTIPQILTWILSKKEFKGLNIHTLNDYAFIMACTNGCILVVQWFLDLNKYNRIISETFQDGFIWVCRNGHINVMNLLLNGDKDLQIDKSTIQNGFEIVCEYGYIEMVKILLSGIENQKIDCDTIQNGFQEACSNGHLDVVMYLLNLKEIQRIGWCVVQKGFQEACENNRIEIVKLLMDLKGNRKVGWDAIQYGFQEAYDNDYTELLKLLQSHIRFGSFGC